MSMICKHISNHISDNLPQFVLGDGIFIGPPRPYDTSADERDGSCPLHIFINESGGLHDVRSIGTKDTHVKKSVKIIIRSSKTIYTNSGGKGAYAESMRTALKLENILREFESSWLEDIKITSPAMYLGKHEDDMHYWSINLRASTCVKPGAIYFGFSVAEYDYTSVIDAGSIETAVFSRSYDVSGSADYRYVGIPAYMLEGFSPTIKAFSGETELAAEQDPQPYSVNGVEYIFYWFSTGDIDPVRLDVFDI